MGDIIAKINERQLVENNVKISLISVKTNNVIKTITGHNNGTIYICKYLRDALSGDYVINERPGTIVPCIAAGNDGMEEITNGVTYQGVIRKNPFDEDADVGCSVTLTFLIPSTFSAAQKIVGFRLYSYSSSEVKKTKKDMYAEIDLRKIEDDPEAGVIITEGTNLKVEWTLSVRFDWIGD